MYEKIFGNTLVAQNSQKIRKTPKFWWESQQELKSKIDQKKKKAVPKKNVQTLGSSSQNDHDTGNAFLDS